MDTPTLVVLFSATAVFAFALGAMFGYGSGALDGYRDGRGSLQPKRGPDGRFIKKD